MNINEIELCDSQVGHTNPTRLSAFYEQLRQRKLIWIIVSIIVVCLIVAIPLIIVKTKKTSVQCTTVITTTAIATTQGIVLTKEANRLLRITQSETSTPGNDFFKWIQDGITVAGGHERGSGLNQLNNPHGIDVHFETKTIYIADTENHRIVEWETNKKEGKVVAGGNGEGNEINQLNYPTDLIVSNDRRFVLICDHKNRRVVQWSLQNNVYDETSVKNVDCFGLALDDHNRLYVSDWKKYQVIRWDPDSTSTEGTIVAGNIEEEEEEDFNPLIHSLYIFVDENYSVYMSDTKNHYVTKWKIDAETEIIVAGGKGNGSSLVHLYHPQGVFLGPWGSLIVADSYNNRITCWLQKAKAGIIIIGGNGNGNKSNQFSEPTGIFLDKNTGTLYVVDRRNHRVQKFDIDSD